MKTLFSILAILILSAQVNASTGAKEYSCNFALTEHIPVATIIVKDGVELDEPLPTEAIVKKTIHNEKYYDEATIHELSYSGSGIDNDLKEVTYMKDVEHPIKKVEISSICHKKDGQPIVFEDYCLLSVSVDERSDFVWMGFFDSYDESVDHGVLMPVIAPNKYLETGDLRLHLGLMWTHLLSGTEQAVNAKVQSSIDLPAGIPFFKVSESLGRSDNNEIYVNYELSCFAQ
jgi:hypothetical protein